MKFSDGTYGEVSSIGVHPCPSESEIAKLMDKLTPAQQLLLERKK